MKTFILLLTLINIHFASAHSGRTNSEGCHNDKQNNSYHCHTIEKVDILTPKNNSGFTAAYDRKNWPHWVDADNDCQHTRAEILIKGSKSAINFKSNKRCNVSWGEWLDPYTGRTFYKASDIDIDHIVPLAHAYEMGGKHWSRAQKREFSNDFENLIAVEDNANQSKRAKPPQEWMPSNIEFHCEYLKRWTYIKTKYGLAETSTEKAYILNMNKICD